MLLKDMFKKPVDRPINGVVKVADGSEESLHQELSEYIVTRELRGHFLTFLDHYTRALDSPTDHIGVWISGFFGSGKSHFLKILSCLLSNRTVKGRKAADYFEDKFNDPIMMADLRRCISVPTESILFNIDIEGPVNKDRTAVLRVFAKMFYNHIGFYGDDLKVARLERFIERRGKTAQFRETFEQVNGASWVSSRDSFAFFEDDVVAVLQSVLGMSEQAARNWFNGTETNELSIAQLVSDIKEYVDSKGDKFRLLFMVDEVGQYIGDDGDLMINLQSLVEEIGTRCRGKVWVMVTSQEAIDSVVHITGDDFSKIQGRFDTRLSLSSSSVDEVIKRRLLEKTPEAAMVLETVYNANCSALRNLFTFNNEVLDIKGYASSSDFIASYPFVSYQFIIIPKVLAEIRRHGNSGKHLSGGERSLLSGFQETAIQVSGGDENTLVPFYLFYDSVHTFLEGAIRRVIDRCQAAADSGTGGLEPQDVNVLKLLYLIRYIDSDIKANIENITVLMIDSIQTDKIALRESVEASLDRLVTQNYVSCSDGIYTFLTDEEQDVASEIRNTAVDSSQIVHSIANIIYGDIYPARKFRYGKYDFPYDQYVDDTVYGSPGGGMRLRIITVAGDWSGADSRRLVMESQVNNEAILVLDSSENYYEGLELALKINKYVKQRNVVHLPESIQEIIRRRQREARALENEARKRIESAIVKAAVYVHGEQTDIRAASARDKLDAALTDLVDSVYSSLHQVTRFAEGDEDIVKALNSSEPAVIPGTGADNEEALNEVSQWLELQTSRMIRVTVGDIQRRYSAIPYGWREIDIAVLIARLIARQKIVIRYGGSDIPRDDRRLPDFLRRRSEIDKATVVRHIAPSEDLVRKSVSFLRDYTGTMSIPSDETGLTQFVVDTFESRLSHLDALLSDFYSRGRYPQRKTVTEARDLMRDILSRKSDSVALLNGLIAKQDELLDASEDMEDIDMFFKSQKTAFDAAAEELERLSREHDYFSADPDALSALNALSDILTMERPYARIKEIPGLLTVIRGKYDGLLSAKKDEVLENVRQGMEDVHQLAGDVSGAGADDILSSADSWFAAKRDSARAAVSLTDLDAMITQVVNYKDSVCRRLQALTAPVPGPGPGPGPSIHNTVNPPKVVNIISVRRHSLCPVKLLKTDADIDAYVDGIRARLKKVLSGCDGIQIS